MKVTGANVYLANVDRLHPVLVELHTDEGISGVGEAAVAYGIGGTAAAGMTKDLVEALLLGRDPFRIEQLWADMYDHSFWAKGGGSIVFAGMSAIETALWDIKGKALGIPVYEFLGGKCRDAVRAYANGWSYSCSTPDEYAAAAERVVGYGYTALKCYPLATPRPDGGIKHVSGRSIDRSAADLAVEKVRAVRRAIGSGVDILVDLSGALTTDETIRLCRRLEELEILLIEEPADPSDLGALKKISERVDIPLAVGERIYTRHGFRRILESNAVDIVQPDIGNTGGIMETKKIAAMAETYNMNVQPHVCGSPVATAAALQLDACTVNVSLQEVYPFRPREHFQLVDHAPEDGLHDGTIPIPDRPGLGISLVAERVRPFLWAEVGSRSS